jgi:hypothetical protein
MAGKGLKKRIEVLMRKVSKGLMLMSLALLGLATLSGCKRSEEAYDNRTLEKRSHVESVKPDNRADPFRP